MAAPGAVSERPELRELVSALSGVSWDNLKLVTLQLNVPNHIAEDTEATHPTNVSSRKIHVLNSWLQMDVTASWENVVAALRSCGLAAEAERIAGQYLPNLVDSSTTTSSSPTNYSDYGGLPTAETGAWVCRGYILCIYQSLLIFLKFPTFHIPCVWVVF